MKIGLFPVIAALCVVTQVSRADISLDDTYEQVIAEKGQPTGRASAGDSMILRYPDGSIRLKGGKVVAINLKPSADFGTRATSAVPPPVTDPAPAAVGSGAALAWRTNYRGALAEAKEQGRHVFLFFTGSDWCGWCKRLNREILSQPAFHAYANEHLVLVEIDFPREKYQSAELKKQNQALQRAFQIEGYPTVVILNEDAREVGRLGYQEGGPDPFIGALKKM